MISIPQRLLGEALLKTAERFPDKTAVISKGKEYSYTQLKDAAEKTASYLIDAGIGKGDRVAVYMNNSWQSAVALYGITLSGAVFLMVNPQTKADKLQFILKDSGSRILITEGRLRNEFSRAVEGTEVFNILLSGPVPDIEIPGVSLNSFDEVLEKQKKTDHTVSVIPNDLASLIYTSGSTGFPKGVMMTHESMVFASWSLIEYLRLDEDDRIILVIPLAFDYGLYQLLMSVTIGGTLIIEQSFAFPSSVYKDIEKYKPTVFPAVPTIFAMMIAMNKKSGLNFPCIKKITNTAAALPAKTIPDLKKVFPGALIFKMYGLTECKRVCYLEPELIDEKPSSVGKAIPGTEVFLLSVDDKPVPAGEPGILHVRGPHVMLGYWNNEKLSNEMLRPGKLPYERVLCTNDWFRMDEDGFLYFLSRNDDIIKTRGEKVSPVEVENVIYKKEGVKEVAVVGIPDEIMGESIVAFVTTFDGKVQEKDIQRICMENLEIFMVPSKVIFLDSMPKSPNGKINKKVLTKMALENE
jgi:acyl-CoA synthetase (AMP-forming)/AMP-acid ligase II